MFQVEYWVHGLLEGTGLLGLSCAEQPAENHLQHTPVSVIVDLHGAVETRGGVENRLAAVGTMDSNTDSLTRLDIVGHARDVERFVTPQIKRFPRLLVLELQGQDTHGDEIATVDALVALGNDGFDAEQEWPFGGPIA